MAAKLKVYRAEIGGAHEWIVAAKSQKDAAAIWGVDQDVFQQGRGGPTTKPALVGPAMADPGTPLRRVLGGKGAFKPIPKTDVETWKLAAKAMGLSGKPKPAPKRAKALKAKPQPKPKAVTKPKGPSKAAVAALAKAEKALAAHVAAAERAERQAADAMSKLEAKQAAARQAMEETRAALEAAVSKARAKAVG
jgi:hypothetical protein